MRINYVGTRLVKEKGINYGEQIRITSPSSVAKTLNDLFEMECLDKEVVVMLMLDTKYKVMSVAKVSEGTVNSSLVSPREIFKTALLQGAVSIILAHNHPTGNPQPSQEDIDVTNRVREAGNVIGVNLLDHIIIGDGNYLSMKEAGYGGL